ncbi:MAG TPA: hypothetical protein VF796_07160 [Humisphaera sp.]
MRIPFVVAVGLLVALAPSARAVEPALLPPDAALATFDTEIPGGFAQPSARASIDADAAVGGGALKVVFHATDPVVPPDVLVPLAGGVDAAKTAGLSFHAKATGGQAGEPVRLRVGLLDGTGRLILQRPHAVPADGKWQRVDLPLDRFRWGDVGGAWAEARTLRVTIESPFAAVWLDDVRLLARKPGDPTATESLRKLAFGDHDARVVEADGLVVATDAPELAEADVLRVLGNMRRARAFVRRAFGDAVRPLDAPAPAALLVFADRPRMTAFWPRAGERWGARIVPPTAGGYTVQDVATSDYNGTKDRPVWLHESVHAIAARDLRLSPGNPRHGWLQEGLANYVQLCVYPQSLPADVYPRAFAGGVQDRPQALFRPLRQVTAERVTAQQYAQVASVVAYLIEERPALLPALARGLADGEPVEKVLERAGTDVGKLEADWLAWGRKRFAAARDDGHFAVPKELERPAAEP